MGVMIGGLVETLPFEHLLMDMFFSLTWIFRFEGAVVPPLMTGDVLLKRFLSVAWPVGRRETVSVTSNSFIPRLSFESTAATFTCPMNRGVVTNSRGGESDEQSEVSWILS